MTTPDTRPANGGSWPIAAAMINFVGPLPDGTPVQDAPVSAWEDPLQQVADAGFDLVDPTDSWLRLADLTPDRLKGFTEICESVGLGIGGISTARRRSGCWKPCGRSPGPRPSSPRACRARESRSRCA